MLDNARPSLRMQRIGRFAGDSDQSWPLRVPVLPVAAARSSQLPTGALDTPDRLLDLDGHPWTVGRGADGPGVRRATASATSRFGPVTAPLRPPPFPAREATNTPSRFASRDSSAPRSSSSSARHCPRSPLLLHLRACPPDPPFLLAWPPPRLTPSPSRLGLPHPIFQASRGRGRRFESGRRLVGKPLRCGPFCLLASIGGGGTGFATGSGNALHTRPRGSCRGPFARRGALQKRRTPWKNSSRSTFPAIPRGRPTS